MSARLIAGLGAAVVLLVSPLAAQNVKERFTGFAINMNGAANTATIDFTITRWSTDAERKTLLSLIPEEHKSAQKLVDALQDMKSVGSIRTPQTLAWDLRYARQVKLPEGGRRIVLVTDRPIGFREAANSTRSMDYPFSILVNTACAAHTLFAACCVTILLGPSSISSLNSTFLLTGKQCITFALLVSASFSLVIIHPSPFVNTWPYWWYELQFFT